MKNLIIYFILFLNTYTGFAQCDLAASAEEAIYSNETLFTCQTSRSVTFRLCGALIDGSITTWRIAAAHGSFTFYQHNNSSPLIPTINQRQELVNLENVSFVNIDFVEGISYVDFSVTYVSQNGNTQWTRSINWQTVAFPKILGPAPNDPSFCSNSRAEFYLDEMGSVTSPAALVWNYTFTYANNGTTQTMTRPGGNFVGPRLVINDGTFNELQSKGGGLVVSCNMDLNCALSPSSTTIPYPINTGSYGVVPPPPDAAVQPFDKFKESIKLINSLSHCRYEWFNTIDPDHTILNTGTEFWPPTSGTYGVRAKSGATWHGCAQYGNTTTPYLDVSPKAFTRTRVMKVEGVHTYADAIAKSTSQAYEESSYFDNQGKLLQAVSRGSAPNLGDIVFPKEYDDRGRELKSYKPYYKMASTSSGNYTINLLGEESGGYNSSMHAAFYSQAPRLNTKPFTITSIENTPIPTFCEYEPQGQDMQGVHSRSEVYKLDAAHPSLTGKKWLFYDVNTGNFQIADNPGGDIVVNEAISPDGARSLTFTNIYGEELLTEQRSATGQSLWTLHGYDMQGRKIIDITPKGYVHIFNASLAGIEFNENRQIINDPQFAKLCNTFLFDDQARLVRTNRTDGLYEQTIYDKYGTPRLTQNFDQVQDSKWSYSTDDYLGRAIESGYIVETIRDRATLQLELDSYTDNFFGKHDLSPSSVDAKWLNVLGFSTGSTHPINRFYYDSYDITGDGQADYKFDATDQNKFANCITWAEFKDPTNSLCAERSFIKGSIGWLTNVYFYDKRGRTIQTRTIDPAFVEDIGDEITITSKGYSFLGDVLVEYTRVQNMGGSVYKQLRSFEYDHRSRLLNSSLKMDNDPIVVEQHHTYNIDGKLKSLGLPGAAPINFSYDLQDRLSAINNPDDINTGEYFAERIFYHKVDTDLPSTHRNKADLGGRISSIKWSSPFNTSKFASGMLSPYQELKTSSYHLGYDGFGRLAKADYVTPILLPTGSQNWALNGDYQNTIDGPGETFAMPFAEYDENSNLLKMEQMGMTGKYKWGHIDRLTYGYENGNQPYKIWDQAQPGDVNFWRSHDLAGASGTTTEAKEYDQSGRLLTSSGTNSSESYQYDTETSFLNKITYSDGRVYTAEYAASGDQIRQTATLPIIFRDAATEFHSTYKVEMRNLYPVLDDWVVLDMPRGRVYKKKTSAQWHYEFHALDHLGSLRAAWKYYPNTSTDPEVGLEPSFAKAANKKYLSDKATLEPSMALEEDTIFENLDETRKLDAIRARSGIGFAFVSAADHKPLGPLKMFDVHKGDSIAVQAPVYWEQTGNSNVFVSLMAYLASILSGAVVPQTQNDGSAGMVLNPLVQLAIKATPQTISLLNSPGKPKAYFRYVRFGKDSAIKWEKVIPVDMASKEVWNDLLVTDNVSEDGWAVAYLVSEGGSPIYSDDFAVSGYRSNLVAIRGYYPYGLPYGKQGGPSGTWGDWTNPDEEIAPGLPGYTGQPEADQEWWGHAFSNFGYRYYDARIGRWHTIR